MLGELDLTDVTLVGFSMGGGEVARYFSLYGSERLHSVVFASSVTPYLMRTPGNPDGPLTLPQASKMTASLTANQDSFYDQFSIDFFSANGELTVSEQQRQEALALCKQAVKKAALACMTAFANTDFRDDLTKVDVPTLVMQGDSDFIVYYEGSGKRTTRRSRTANYTSSSAPHTAATSATPTNGTTRCWSFWRNSQRRPGSGNWAIALLPPRSLLVGAKRSTRTISTSSPTGTRH